MDIVGALEKIVGPKRVTTSEPVRDAYSFNFALGKSFPLKPDIIVMPETVEHVSQILKAANQYRVPVTPKGAIGLTGCASPRKGGILLDMALMDKILSIDVKNMKAIAEGGCSYYKLTQELYKQGLMLPMPVWYAGASVAASAILPSNGMGKTRYGDDTDLVEGFEVVLPDGEIIRVGSMAYADTDFGPFYRFINGPDLVGLFTKSTGIFGIITKVAHYCLRLPKYWSFHAYAFPRESIQDLTDVLIDSTAMEVFDAHVNDKWRWMREQRKIEPENYHFTLTYALNGFNRKELEGREESVEQICRDRGGTYIPGFGEYFHIQWPSASYYFATQYSPKLTPPPPNGVKTLGAFHELDEHIYPTSHFPEVYNKIEEVLQKYGVWDHLPIKPVFDGYPIKRLIIASQTWVRVNDHDPYWIKQFQDAQAEMRNWFVHKGGLYQQRMPPLLMPEYVWDVQMGAFNLTRSIKEKLDPHNILSPGLYDFMESAR